MQNGHLRFLDAAGDLVAELEQASRTETLIERTQGLLGRPALAKNEGLIISPCNSVHTFGMGYALDLVYVSGDGRIRKIHHSMPPRRVSACWRAASTLELAAGTAARLGLRLGHKVEWNDNA